MEMHDDVSELSLRFLRGVLLCVLLCNFVALSEQTSRQRRLPYHN